jgi:DNA recombination protein RmuC
MLALKTVDHIWTVERREQNAEAIADRAGKLYDKVAGFVTDMQRVGTALTQASKAHEDAIGKLSKGRGNVLGQIEKLRTMGARTTKDIVVEFDAEGQAPQRLAPPAAE